MDVKTATKPLDDFYDDQYRLATGAGVLEPTYCSVVRLVGGWWRLVINWRKTEVRIDLNSSRALWYEREKKWIKERILGMK